MRRDSDDEDQEEEEKSLEECSTLEKCILPLMTSPEDQGAKSTESASSQVEPVRLVLVTGLTRDKRKQSKKCSQRRSRQAQPSSRSTSSSEVDHKCLMAKSKKMIKEDEDQKVEAIKALTLDLEKIKLEQASLIQRYNELSNDYANVTNSIACVASLEKEN